jgi:hypothetical protein
VQREFRRFMWIGGRTEGRTDSQANFYDENGGNLNVHNTKICGVVHVYGTVFIVRLFLLIWEVIEVFGFFYYFKTLSPVRPHSILSHTFHLFLRYVN